MWRIDPNQGLKQESCQIESFFLLYLTLNIVSVQYWENLSLIYNSTVGKVVSYARSSMA